MVAEAINWALRRLGIRGCAGQMAQEFGGHPDAAATRMRWVRQLAWPADRPPASLGAEPPGRSPQRTVAPAASADHAAAAAWPERRLDGHEPAKRYASTRRRTRPGTHPTARPPA